MSHRHHHHYAPARFDRAFALGVSLNLRFCHRRVHRWSIDRLTGLDRRRRAQPERCAGPAAGLGGDIARPPAANRTPNLRLASGDHNGRAGECRIAVCGDWRNRQGSLSAPPRPNRGARPDSDDRGRGRCCDQWADGIAFRAGKRWRPEHSWRVFAHAR